MKIKRILISGLAVVLLSSCSDFLTVESPSSYSEDFVYSQKTEISRALNGVYASILVDNLYGDLYQRTFVMNSDVDLIRYNHQNPNFNQYNLPVAETGSIKGKDPLFVNLAQENFNLLKSSPAIGQGKSVIAPIEDYNGNLFEITNRSIGAIEYQKVSNNDDLNTSSMLVYPNPSKGLIHIISNFLNNEHLRISIYSIQGTYIKSIPINTTTNPSIDLQMNDGTYMYIIEDSKKNILKRSLLLISK